METRLRDEVAIVTGATSGLGEAIAKRFAAQGASVVVVGRNQQRGENVVRAIADAGGVAVFHAADVTDEDAVRGLVEATVSRFGKLTSVVNNAGLSVPGSVLDISHEQWETVFRINVTSAYLVSHHAMPHLLKHGNSSVVNISSEAGLKGLKNRSAYCAAKAALIGLTKAMAVDHSPNGVRVNCVCPGTIETPMVSRLIADHENPAKMKEEFIQRRLTPYLGTPDDIAEAALYFASPANSFTTGAILSVDGGALAK